MAPFYRGFEVKPRLHDDDIKAIQVSGFSFNGYIREFIENSRFLRTIMLLISSLKI